MGVLPGLGRDLQGNAMCGVKGFFSSQSTTEGCKQTLTGPGVVFNVPGTAE